MTSKMPPIPPAERSNKGPGSNPPAAKDKAPPGKSVPDNLAEEGQQGNIRQNTTARGRQDR